MSERSDQCEAGHHRTLLYMHLNMLMDRLVHALKYVDGSNRIEGVSDSSEQFCVLCLAVESNWALPLRLLAALRPYSPSKQPYI